MYINILPKNKSERGDNFFTAGLKDLSLSANPGISQKSWAKFGISVAANSCLRELYLDYNSLGDYAASCIVVGLSGSQNLRVLDLESTNIGDSTAEVCAPSFFSQNNCFGSMCFLMVRRKKIIISSEIPRMLMQNYQSNQQEILKI